MLRFKRCIICYLGIIGSLVLLMNSAQADSLLECSKKMEMSHKTCPTALLFPVANDVQELRETFQKTQLCFDLCTRSDLICSANCMGIDGELGEQCYKECKRKENECKYKCTKE